MQVEAASIRRKVRVAFAQSNAGRQSPSVDDDHCSSRPSHISNLSTKSLYQTQASSTHGTAGRTRSRAGRKRLPPHLLAVRGRPDPPTGKLLGRGVGRIDREQVWVGQQIDEPLLHLARPSVVAEHQRRRGHREDREHGLGLRSYTHILSQLLKDQEMRVRKYCHYVE